MKTTKFIASLFAALVTSGSFATTEATQDGWYPQKVFTNDYSFAVKIDPLDSGHCTVQAIRILDRKTGEVTQEIRDINGMDVFCRPDELVSVVDVNADGRPDISIPFASGGAGPNSTNYYYIFESYKGKFEFNQLLSDLPQSSVGAGGIIFSEYRDGCCHHHSETYRFANSKLTLIADSDDIFGSDGTWREISTRKLVRGRWRTSVQRISERQAPFQKR